jgi:hypothetical protein
MEPLRRYLKANPPQPSHPWHGTPEEERLAWLEAHYHPPRLVPATESKGELPTMPKYRIFYARQPTFHPSGQFGVPLWTISTLLHSHAHLGEIETESLGDVWLAMQGENWSPNGEARPLLEHLGLTHTSMSVGDVARDEEGIYWECVDPGWRRIKDHAQGEDGDGQT